MPPPPGSPHVLWIVPRMMWPAASGGEIRVLSLLRHLSARYRLSLVIPVPEGQERQYQARALYLERRWVARVLLVPRRGWPALGPREKEFPKTVQAFYDPNIEEAVRDAARKDPVDLIQLEFSEMGQYAAGARRLAPTLLTEHDAGFLSRKRSYLSEDEEGAGEHRRRVVYEKEVFRHCDRVIALSAGDARVFGRLTSKEKIRIVPTGVNLEDFPFQGLEGREPSSAVFVGYYPHFPNEDAAIHLCKDIWPLLLRRVPEAKLSLVGSCPTPPVRGLASPSVEVAGTVPKVHPHLAKARLFMAPVRLGKGFKGKLLEAFASGTPVVACPQSCEAMPDLKDGKHLMIARTPEEFARKGERILKDDALSARLARAARRYVQARFGYDHQADLLDKVYREVLAFKSGKIGSCS